ncbi:DNA adenine methylase [Ornithobacterium rhinotracheale]|uniref:DNA adenine methylase n=1 Tax=Ornithobacterium rhinotracheale TaxID=28251 RepID=UPI00129CDEE0|nr:DNA adenine methylase [Ornithobacterium rhinotracheale]MRI64489.1 DNA adenine methylase [Ornithobacterium rhinotracheale]
MKKYNASPLPFQGQKRMFIKQFKTALQEFPENATYVDLFGGSGLLAHTIKQEKPKARVIWNDYDNFQERLNNIGKTNALLQKIDPYLKQVQNWKYPPHAREEILALLAAQEGFVDYMTLSASLLFSGCFAPSLEELKKNKSFYTKRKSFAIYTAEGYLQGVERVQRCYTELIEEFKNTENVVFVLDPPYLTTDTTNYRSDKYWTLKDYLTVIKYLVQMESFFYFTSHKSDLVEFASFYAKGMGAKSPFEGAKRMRRINNLSKTATYEDIMLYKF